MTICDDVKRLQPYHQNHQHGHHHHHHHSDDHQHLAVCHKQSEVPLYSFIVNRTHLSEQILTHLGVCVCEQNRICILYLFLYLYLFAYLGVCMFKHSCICIRICNCICICICVCINANQLSPFVGANLHSPEYECPDSRF